MQKICVQSVAAQRRLGVTPLRHGEYIFAAVGLPDFLATFAPETADGLVPGVLTND